MEQYLNYENKKVHFTLPKEWNVVSGKEKPPAKGATDPLEEIRRALDEPIGSPPLEELARPGMEVVLLFDDLQRPTPAHWVLPEMMDCLNRAGVTDKRITAICALGTHPTPSPDKLKAKVGDAVMNRLDGRVYAHKPHATDNVIIGRTHRGTLVEINPRVAFADLIIGVGQCMPHPISGYSGGYKLVMPGVCSYRSVADHHFTWMRHRNSRVNVFKGNYFFEDIVEAGRLSRMAFKMDMIINEKNEVVRAFAGEVEAMQQEAARYAESLYLSPLTGLADVTVTSAFPLEVGVQATKALVMAGNCTRAGGCIIWVAPQKEAGPIMPLIKEMGSTESAADFHRRLIRGDIPDHLREFGISYIMMVVYFKELAEKFRVIHVTEGLSPDMVRMMKYDYAPDLQTAVKEVSKSLPNAHAALFPSGGTAIPHVR